MFALPEINLWSPAARGCQLEPKNPRTGCSGTSRQLSMSVCTSTYSVHPAKRPAHTSARCSTMVTCSMPRTGPKKRYGGLSIGCRYPKILARDLGACQQRGERARGVIYPSLWQDQVPICASPCSCNVVQKLASANTFNLAKITPRRNTNQKKTSFL